MGPSDGFSTRSRFTAASTTFRTPSRSTSSMGRALCIRVPEVHQTSRQRSRALDSLTVPSAWRHLTSARTNVPGRKKARRPRISDPNLSGTHTVPVNLVEAEPAPSGRVTFVLSARPDRTAVRAARSVAAWLRRSASPVAGGGRTLSSGGTNSRISNGSTAMSGIAPSVAPGGPTTNEKANATSIKALFLFMRTLRRM